MRTYLLILTFLVVSPSIAGGLPRSCFGDYAGVMQAYDVVKNDVEMHIEKHDVRVSITETEIIYSTGNITLKGGYTFIKQSKVEYLIKANFSNGKSLSYEMNFIWNKKLKTIHIAGQNGEPDVDLEKLDD